MDIKRTPQEKKPLDRKIVIGVAIGACILGIWHLLGHGNSIELSASQLLYAKVQEGNLVDTVSGYGMLNSTNRKLLTALTDATVKEILLKPGAIVDEDSVIMVLSNPNLIQEAEISRQGMIQEEANLRKLKLDQNRELLEEKSNYLELKSQSDAATLTKEAQSLLLESGAVSLVSYKQIELQVNMLNKQLKIQSERVKQLSSVHKEAINIQQERIRQAEAAYETQKYRVAALNVKAEMKGVMQRLPVALGQSIQAGQELAQIGSMDQLVADIRVSQTEIEKVEVGQKVIIDTRRDQIQGEVFRIDPTVENGTVLVEVSLIGDLPNSARPQLNVDGRIQIGSIEKALYVERPVNVQGNSVSDAFILAADGQSASLRTVNFGNEVGKFIQIKSGVETSDTLILSDLSIYKDTRRILLK